MNSQISKCRHSQIPFLIQFIFPSRVNGSRSLFSMRILYVQSKSFFTLVMWRSKKKKRIHILVLLLVIMISLYATLEWQSEGERNVICSIVIFFFFVFLVWFSFFFSSLSFCCWVLFFLSSRMVWVCLLRDLSHMCRTHKLKVSSSIYWMSEWKTTKKCRRFCRMLEGLERRKTFSWMFLALLAKEVCGDSSNLKNITGLISAKTEFARRGNGVFLTQKTAFYSFLRFFVAKYQRFLPFENNW